MSQTITLNPGETLIVTAAGASPTPQPTPTPDPKPVPVPTPAGVRIVTLPWANSPNTPMGETAIDEVIAVEITTGSISSTGSLPFIAAAEYNSPPRDRYAVLSETPGDFDHPFGGAPGAVISGKSITAKFAVGSGSGFGYYPVIPLNHRVYLNIRTTDQGAPSDSRQMFVSLSINQL